MQPRETAPHRMGQEISKGARDYPGPLSLFPPPLSRTLPHNPTERYLRDALSSSSESTNMMHTRIALITHHWHHAWMTAASRYVR